MSKAAVVFWAWVLVYVTEVNPKIDGIDYLDQTVYKNCTSRSAIEWRVSENWSLRTLVDSCR